MDGSIHLPDYLFLEKEQGFLRLLAFSPCFLLNQQSPDGVWDLDVGAGVRERLEREGDFTEREGDFTETGDLRVRDDTRFTCRSSESRFSKKMKPDSDKAHLL